MSDDPNPLRLPWEVRQKMAAENTGKVPLPTHLDQIHGNARQRMLQRVAIIKDHGFDAWSKLCRDSMRDVK